MRRSLDTPLRIRPGFSWGLWGFLALFLAIPVAVELTLQASDADLIGSARWRAMAYQFGAFWPGLLDNWRPNYAAQPWTMFVSYLFLHTGLWHLAGNMMTFVMLFAGLKGRIGGRRLAVIYLASALGGAIGFAMLGTEYRPMVGSSGALFGLVAAWRWQDWCPGNPGGFRAWMFLRDCAGLTLLNVLMWITEGGALAWEAHLGGFVAGFLTVALWLRPAGAS